MLARLGTKALLTRVGEHLKVQHIHRLNAVVNYLEVGRWFRVHGLTAFPRHSTRTQLHAAIAASVADPVVLYLEFGVYAGASLRHWSSLLRNPASELHGFDSFEGLPEDWDALRKRGEFTLGGQLPQFKDQRVVLHKGWFSDTLPGFELPAYEQLVIHIDADLYTSTEFVLRTLEGRIIPGTILMFDEFCDRFHELRAFDEYLERTKTRFRCLGATKNLEQVVFGRIA